MFIEKIDTPSFFINYPFGSKARYNRTMCISLSGQILVTILAADFIAGFRQLIAMFDNDQTPRPLLTYIQRAAQLLKTDIAVELGQTSRATPYSPLKTIYFGHFLL